MIRILHVVSVMDVGGMESFIMNMYRRMDRTAIQFDFLVHHKRRGAFEDEIERLGGRVYHLSLMDDFNLPKYLRQLKRLFDDHPEYRVVHGHLGSTAFFYLGEAARHGLHGRILHSHTAACDRTVKGFIKKQLFRIAPRYANVRLACSDKAGKCLFPHTDFEFVPNGIDANAFRYDPVRRNEMRKWLGVANNVVYGLVGRMHSAKNHAFLLDVFANVRKGMPEARLLLVGDGELMEAVRGRAERLGLMDSIIFAGLQMNAADWYQAMDVFAMPSLFEGLPLTGVEAQCAGLPCFFSDQITREAAVSDRAVFLPIGSENIDRWAKALTDAALHIENRCDALPERALQFDIGSVADAMARRYQQLWKENA